MTQAQKESFASLLEESLGGGASLEGTVVKGTVVSIESDFVLIDVGLKSEGRVPLREFVQPGQVPEIKVGDIVDVYLERMEDKLDEISKERRDEAREHGGLEVRVSTLESRDRATRALVYTVSAAVVVGFLAWLFRLALAHPEVVSK